MIINPSLPGGHTIFCDDVREEVSGKQTLVGAYGAIMYVAEFPATLPQIYCVIFYRQAIDAFGKVTLRVIHEVEDSETVVAEIGYDVPEGIKSPEALAGPFPRLEGRFIIQLAPFNIGGPGVLKVRAFRNDDEIRLGALQIAHAPSSVPEVADLAEPPELA